MEIKQALFYRSIMNDKDLPNDNRIKNMQYTLYYAQFL